MVSAYVKDNTANSMTKGKKIIVPATVLECPPVKIFSVRFHKDNKLVKEVLAENLDKELKRKVKLPKTNNSKIEDIKDYDDISVIVYSQVKKTNIKKTPDLSEIGLAGNAEEKMHFIKEHLGKEISITSVFEKGQLVDFRGLTTGRGFQGPIKRFGLGLRFHKSEKGQRGPGSIGAWHPARISFRIPRAGQMGMFTRIAYNHKILDLGKEKELKGIKNFGDVKTEYIIVSGSVQGPSKRQVLVTAPLRETRKQKAKNYEVLELR
jgi:large subunit ribosomal protein L3